MSSFVSWMPTAYELLLAADDDALLAVLGMGFGRRDATVELMLEDLSVDEAVSFARVLAELGRDVEAEEVLLATAAAMLGDGRPQGSQHHTAPMRQGGQVDYAAWN